MRASFALVCLLLSLAPSNSAPGPEPAHLLILKLEDSEKEGLLDAQNGKANIHNKIQFDDKELKIQLISDKETVENHPAITRASNDHHVVDITREASDFNELSKLSKLRKLNSRLSKISKFSKLSKLCSNCLLFL